MTTQTLVLTHTRASAAFRRMLDLVRARRHAAAVRRIERAARRDLSSLPDETLRDIGLTRATIDEAARGCALAIVNETRRVAKLSG